MDEFFCLAESESLADAFFGGAGGHLEVLGVIGGVGFGGVGDFGGDGSLLCMVEVCLRDVKAFVYR